MSSIAAHATEQLEHSLAETLSARERLRISTQLGTGMLAGGLLLIGIAIQNYQPGNQRLVGELFKAMAALIVAAPIFWEAATGLIRRDARAQSEQLIAIATLAAMAIGDFVTATLLPLIMHLGHFLEERSVMGAKSAVDGLRSLQNSHALVRAESGDREIPVDELQPGDILVVHAGDYFAADGLVVEGSSSVDQSMITGESTPADVCVDSSVFAGAINLSGSLLVRVTRVGASTAIGRIVQLLREAEQSKTPVLRLVENYAGYATLVVLTIAAAVLFISRDVQRAIAVLVVGCPIPFVLAGPTAMISAMAAASRQGILIKNTKFLESLADANAVVFDKTGTLTQGALQLVKVIPLAEFTEEDLLRQAMVCARGSRHPVCRAIVEAAKSRGIEPTDSPGELQELAGRGVLHSGDSKQTFLGRSSWLTETGFELPDDPSHLGAIVWLGTRDSESWHAIGAILLADQLRDESQETVVELRSLGIDRQVLLTGDRKEIANLLGESLAFDEVVAEVLPEQKLTTVQQEKNLGHTVMVVGDGVNDALALAAGDVGIAMGGIGSDIALKSADIVLARNDLSRLPNAVRLARRTRSTIHQNILVGAALTLGMLGLAATGTISPLAGAVLQNVGEIYVVLNSARLLKFLD